MEITVSLKDECLKMLQEISKESSIEKEELIKSSIVKYIQEYKLRKAIRKYTEGEISLGKASEIADIPKRMLLYKLREIGIPLNLTETDIENGMDILKEQRKLHKATA
ncbi:MAG: UPF0175 family protein [Candidatus Methanoperedens sp.]|jgi:predicted HTH domain antitoxin|nr:UPF0175 family protein [Candidatus Methanoperedens sp.]PKL52931.1 MAG: hypothetical protein CVV36_09760 [Candidatus Methanoperedenaceae archaeon HGW-Methanoperedenaceae-1]